MTFEDKYSRLCDLMNIMLDSPSVTDAMQRMMDRGWQVSPRQMQRDVASLRAIGIDIKYTGKGYSVKATEDYRSIIEI
jgi:predicted DNA-binding transcriptional regulator YafY